MAFLMSRDIGFHVFTTHMSHFCRVWECTQLNAYCFHHADSREKSIKCKLAKDVWWLSHDMAIKVVIRTLPSLLVSLDREASENKEPAAAAGRTKLSTPRIFWSHPVRLSQSWVCQRTIKMMKAKSVKTWIQSCDSGGNKESHRASWLWGYHPWL